MPPFPVSDHCDGTHCFNAAGRADASNARFTTNYPEISLAPTYTRMTLEHDYQASALAMARGANGGNMLDRAAQFTTVRKDYQDKVNALIGAPAGAAFMQRNRTGAVTTTGARPGGN